MHNAHCAMNSCGRTGRKSKSRIMAFGVPISWTDSCAIDIRQQLMLFWLNCQFLCWAAMEVKKNEEVIKFHGSLEHKRLQASTILHFILNWRESSDFMQIFDKLAGVSYVDPHTRTYRFADDVFATKHSSADWIGPIPRIGWSLQIESDAGKCISNRFVIVPLC